MMFSNQVRQQRWTFAVGQGLLHYEEIRLMPSTCRPITIVYDAGSLSKHKNKNDTAYRSIGKVNRRLARYCDRTIDFLVLSHFHADHYNLMSKLLERNKVRNFVAPLLTKEGNSVEIAALAYQWLSKEQNSNENEIKLIAALVDRGTRGFCEQLFREYEKPDHFYYITNEPGIYASETSDDLGPIYYTSPSELENNYRPRNEGGARNNNYNTNYIIINHSQPILIRDRGTCLPFWKIAFYYNTPDINPPKYWDAAKNELKNQLDTVLKEGSHRPDGIKRQFEEIFSKKTYLPYEEEVGGNTEKKKVKFKDVFGYADVNMTSLTMYSGFDLMNKNVEYRTLSCQNPYRNRTNPRLKLEHKIANLLVHTARETSNKKRQSINESFISESVRREILGFLYPNSEQFAKPQGSEGQNSNLFWYYLDRKSNKPGQPYIRPSCVRNHFWSWIGFGDMNFGDTTIADNLIEHFEKQGGLLERVGCCSAPHHGSHNGFATDRIPSQFKGAVCLISCDPDRTGFGHPRIEAVISILKGGMLPILVSDQEQTTFHEVLRWPLPNLSCLSAHP